MLTPYSLRYALACIGLALAGTVAQAQSRRTVCISDGSSCAHAVTEAYEYDYVDVPPAFPGGDLGLMRYINESRRYPADAYSRKVQGRVMCSFVVNADGSVSHVRVIKGVEASLNNEAVRVISEMPRWNAGQVNGEAVPVHCLLPIPFRL